MSRVSTPPAAQPSTQPVQLPHDKIAMRAYEKWQKRGCVHGYDYQDWCEAEAELRTEMGQGTTRGTVGGFSRR